MRPRRKAKGRALLRQVAWAAQRYRQAQFYPWRNLDSDQLWMVVGYEANLFDDSSLVPGAP